MSVAGRTDGRGPAERITVGVVGLGLIGGSVARSLVARGGAVVATDPSPATRADASAIGIAVADDVAALATQRPDVVVLAAPLRAMRAVAGEVAAALGQNPGWDPTVTDVGSVKAPVREAVADAGLAGRYVGAHPMSGTERSGFGASSAELMQGIPWAVTCAAAEAGVAGTDPVRLERVLRLVTGPLGGTAAVLTDDLHDEAAALVSHVPHVLANQLLGAVSGAPVRDLALRLAAGSFRDGTRVGLTDPRRTEAMVTENAAWVAPVLRLAARDLERLAGELESNAPTHWFFDRPDPVRELIGRPGGPRVTGLRPGDGNPRPGVGSDAEVVPLTGDWPGELVARCAQGAVVIRLDERGAELRSAR